MNPMKRYKASELVKVEYVDGRVEYGLPNHIPMHEWNDYKIVPNEEVEDAPVV